MINHIVLHTEGYTLTFEMQELEHLPEEVDLTVRFSLDDRLAPLVAISIAMPTMMSDLRDMIAYFEEHIANLQRNPSSEAEIFVPLDLHFQMRASAGNVDSSEDGEFAFQFLVNVGKPYEGAASVYVGGEAQVMVENINRFIAALREVIAEHEQQ